MCVRNQYDRYCRVRGSCAAATLSSMSLQAYAEMAFVNIEFGSTEFWVLLLLDFCGWHARQ